MKIMFSIRPKVKVAISMAIIILLVITTNFINSRHFNTLKEQITSVYQDRLMVEIYIYKISGMLHEKQRLFDKGPEMWPEQAVLNDSIVNVIEAYETTYLTQEEEVYFNQLKSDFLAALAWENGPQTDASKRVALYDSLESHLQQLSAVQGKEGKRLTEESGKIVASSKINLQFELVVLIIIALVIQALIFAAKSERPKFHQKSNLN